MTVSRGASWGEAADAPDDLRIVRSDHAAHELVARQRAAGVALEPLGLSGGDLARTMGGGTDRFPGTVTKATVDIVRVQTGEAVTWAVAHIVARRRWWRGEVLFAMNAEFLGHHDVAPRSHPNDGKVDIVHVAADMSLRARLAAMRRARTGTHVPHPQLSSRQATEYSASFARPLTLWVDGQRWRRSRDVTVTVEPDALTVYA